VSDESEPPRKFYGLKPTEFERVNAHPAPPVEPAASGAPPAEAPGSGPINVQDLFRQAQMSGPVLSSQANRKVDSNDVHVILRENLARDEAAGLYTLAPKEKRPSKRKRHYWIMMITSSTVLGPMAIITGFQTAAGNRGAAPPFVLCLSALILIQVSLWWVMWHVVDDYFD
jgi:hypothetical protein